MPKDNPYMPARIPRIIKVPSQSVAHRGSVCSPYSLGADAPYTAVPKCNPESSIKLSTGQIAWLPCTWVSGPFAIRASLCLDNDYHIKVVHYSDPPSHPKTDTTGFYWSRRPFTGKIPVTVLLCQDNLAKVQLPKNSSVGDKSIWVDFADLSPTKWI